MVPRILLAGMVVVATGVVFIPTRPANAIDRYWQGDVSNVYTLNTNWNAGAASPRASQSERAVIGTDNPDGALDSDDAPFGSPVLATAALPPGGIALGIREFDYNDIVPDSDYVNPAPAAGTLIGRFLIQNGASISALSTGQAQFGADGRILVGVEGRGYLTMTGGSLTGQGLVVAGEEINDADGTSLVDLSGSAALNIEGGSTGTATFGRRLRISGPDVTFHSTGTLRLQASNTYTAAITSATAHSPLTTDAAAVLAGDLFVEFSGAAATRDPIATLGQTWDLVSADLAIAGGFSNVLVGGDVPISGLAPGSEAPAGAAYRLRQTDAGGPTVLQLAYQRLLVLEVDRGSGDIAITNPHGGDIEIEGYTVRSPTAGSLLASYHGIADANPPIAGAGDWAKPVDGDENPLNNRNALTEFLEAGFDPNENPPPFDLTSLPTVSLGTGFSRTAVADDVNRFGMDGEDLIFEYATPTDGVVRGHVMYTGTKFENDLVLRVNPNTGQAFLKNDSLETLTFDGYSILSSTNSLDAAGWTGLGGSWEKTPAGSNAPALTETNLDGSITLNPTDEVGIGDISASGFTSDEAQEGLSLEFILVESLVSGGGGDYNEDGVVNAADYVRWRNLNGQSVTLPNENPNAATPGVVDQEDYDFWVQQFGGLGGGQPEPELRVGSIVFDPTAGSGAGGAVTSSAVPEPGTALLALMGVGASLLARRKRRAGLRTAAMEVARGTIGQIGVANMSRHCRQFVGAVIGVSAALLLASPAGAQPQGIPLENQDFNLPGSVKTVPFDANGDFVPDVIPGWIFSGPGVETRFNPTDPDTMEPLIRGDSSIEPGGGFGPDEGTHLTLSTLDGTVYQTSNHNILNIPNSQVYQLSFEAFDAFTIDGEEAFTQILDRAELTAWLYYENGGVRTPIATGAFNLLNGTQMYTVEVTGGDAALDNAIGHPVGVEFDTTTIEFNEGMPEFPVAHSWVAIDNVLLQIAGVTRGDLNGDGVVNEVDYGIVRDNQQVVSDYFADGELTRDGLVNLNDFREIKNLISAQPGAGAGDGVIPEPSTCLLALLMAMLVGGTRFLRQTRIGRLSRVAVLALVGMSLLAATAPESSAELLLYEPFDIPPYTPDVPLEGQNPTIGPGNPPFFSGAWEIGATGEMVVAGSLEYLGSESSGGSVTSLGEGRVGRYLTTPWDNSTSGTFYLGYQADYGTVGNPNSNAGGELGFRTTEFWPADGAVGVDNGRSEVGFQGFAGDPQQQLPRFAQLRWVTPGGGTQFLTDTVFNEFAGPHLIVLKYELSSAAASDSISVFLDPTSTEEPELANASASGLDYTLSAISTISKFGSTAGIRPVFDELRVATTFAEAIPMLPLPGDTNGDGFVDMLDYNAIISHLNLTGQTTANGDVAGPNGRQGTDGRVDLRDLNLWRRSRTDLAGSGTSADESAIPEPATLALGLVALGQLAWLTGAGRKRKKVRT